MSDQCNPWTDLPRRKYLLAHVLVGRRVKIMEGRHMRGAYVAPVYIYIYIYIFIYICVCVCVCVWFSYGLHNFLLISI